MENEDFLAQKKLKIIEPFLNKEKKLKEIEEESNVSYATLKRWVKAYKESGLEGLNKKERADKNNYKKLEPKELEKIKKLYGKNKNLSISKLYEQYSTITGKMNISYPTFYRIINNLDSFVKNSSKPYIKTIEVPEYSYGIFQYPVYFPFNLQKIYYITLFFEISTLRIVNYSFDKEQKTFKKLYLFLRESILKEGVFPKEIFLTNTILEVSKKSLRECFFETSISFLIDDDFDYSELRRFSHFLELDLSHQFYGNKNITENDIFQFLNAYIYIEQKETRDLEFYYQRKLDFFLTKSIRKVNRSRIRLKNYIYFSDVLKDFENEILEIKHSPYNETAIIVYENKDFICEAFRTDEI
ncbi:MAG: helix-turn-helix domain-containing protein [Fusobacteriaceae bacterium]|nr:helix-turn-helix domain-containing protein [Fusobacteriaceae bacterium]